MAHPFLIVVRWLLLAAALFVPGETRPAVAADQVSATAEYFERHVRPILARRCYECHSRETGPDNGELILDHPAGIAAGGTRGSILDPSATGTSLLLRAVGYAEPELQMPPDGRLPPEELTALERWIQSGAGLPEYSAEPRSLRQSIDYAVARDFWSLQPLTRIPVPEVSGSEWGNGAVDAFILERLSAHGLQPGPQADRSLLYRRLTFDLIGLPPTIDDLAAFCSNEDQNAWEQAVDRLLASPHYGERWARSWLDLARFTDFTPDWQSPTDRGWIYRDWVVRAMNSNMPFDRFIRLQLAADLFPDTDPKDLAALGFLGLSPTYWKELRLAPAVIEQIVADEWDERIDTVTRTVLGLTVSCARCHDHKFDPVSTEDYYALAGIFASTQLDERPLLPPAQAQHVRTVRMLLGQLEAEMKQLGEQNSSEVKQIARQIQELRQATPDVDLPDAHVVREASIHVLPDGDELTKLEYRESESRDLPVFRRGNPSNPGAVVPRRYLQIFADTDSEDFSHGSGRRQLADSMFRHSPGLIARVIVNRVWDQHFGSGLVRTTSDFGQQGERPTHPDLLEYLAAEFVHHEWDMKWLHRQILLSAAWKQSSSFREDGDSVDPENRLIWRMNRRRLDIEMWRDALLAVTGQLDRTIGGPSGAIDDPRFVRRTLYVTVAREELHPVLRMHDFPEASAHSPRREHTITPLQQLYFLNAEWMRHQASEIRPVLDAFSDDYQRLNHVWLLLFSRQPTGEERKVADEFLRTGAAVSEDGSSAQRSAAGSGDEQPDSADDRWTRLLLALFGLNEFHFVD